MFFCSRSSVSLKSSFSIATISAPSASSQEGFEASREPRLQDELKGLAVPFSACGASVETEIHIIMMCRSKLHLSNEII